MPFCSACGSQLKLESVFCSQCGSPSGSSDESKFSKNISQTALSSNATTGVVNKEALTLANQSVLAFLWMFFCEFKGADAADAFKNITTYIVVFLILIAITYFFIVIKGVKESKSNFVLIPAIILLVIYVAALFLTDQSNNNIFDWLSYVVGFIQVGLLYRIYSLLKSSTQ